uniref:ATP synthase complex subunit 8 n=1 Tax=Lachesilla sp. LaspGHN TaxID=2597012 RepID=A0A8K1ZFZ1_9NEOP|nr:ATP synthase F0 subunit 8 [Lachesilla sp. LaspGHN]
MPQMNPMLWLPLFIIFLTTFLMINPLIFFSKNFYSLKTLSSSSLKSINWKW